MTGTQGGRPPEPDPGDRWTVPPWVERVSRWSWAYLGFVAAVVVTAVAMAALRDLVIPLAIAVLLAVVFAPAVDRLERRHVPRSLGAMSLVILICAVAVLVVVAVAAGIADRSDELGEQLNQAIAVLQRELERLTDLITLPSIDLHGAGSALLGGAAGQVGSLLDSTIAFATGTVLALVLLYYLLKDGRSMIAAIAVRRSPSTTSQTERILQQAGQSIRSYARGRALLALVQGAAITVLLAVIDVPLAVTIGLVNFVGAFIPYLGAIIGGAFAVLVALSEGGFDLALLSLAVVLAVNLLLENLLEPRLMGSSMHMHPVVVLLATVAGGLVAGLFGLIVAAPLASIGANLFRELREAGFFRRQST